MFDDIDRALLTREQRQRLEILEQGFQSTFWELVKERFQERFEQFGVALDGVQGEQNLGIVQGHRRAFYEVTHLEDAIRNEYQAILDEQEVPEPEGPEFDDAWH